MVVGRFDDVMPILLSSSFKCSSSNLAEDFPLSGFNKVIAIAKFEQLLHQIDVEFGWVAAAESVNHFLHIIAFTVLERIFGHVLVFIGVLDLESGLRLIPCQLESF
jgi:hypothetical protein